MSTGTANWFNLQKGFGFIRPDDGARDAFVHVSAGEHCGIDELRQGQKLHQSQKIGFEPVTDPVAGEISADPLAVPA